jgi:hydrogenase maturation protease
LLVKTQRGLTVTSWLGLEGELQSADVLAADFIAADAAPLSLVLGFGNVLLGDDGAGVQLVERLRSELGPGAADFIDAGTLSFSLLPYIEATTSMLVIDAAEINALPGTISLFEGLSMDEFLSSTRRRSVHEVGLIDLLDMARLRDCLPPRRALLCIQPGRIDWSEELSVPVEEALDEAGRQVVALLKRWNNS